VNWKFRFILSRELFHGLRGLHGVNPRNRG
jgi:hypothetical protein